MAIPPPPPGFQLVDRPPPDPVDILIGEGFVPTNGYRTDADTARIRAQGYHPAINSKHNDGDGIDWTHPGMSMSSAEKRIREVMGSDGGWTILNEGHHVHTQKPGYGRAPGTPGTDRFGLPEPPPGFTITQRGSLTDGNYQPTLTPGGDLTQSRMETIDYGTRRGDWTPEEGNRLKANIVREASRYPDGNVPVVENPVAGYETGFDMPRELASKLTPDQINQYIRVAADPKSTADQLRAKVKEFGFDLKNADSIIAHRNKGEGVNRDPRYLAPQLNAAPEGKVATAERGALDFTNMLDEYQALRGASGQGPKQSISQLSLTNPLSWVNVAADYLLPQSGETPFNSDRSFGEILSTNIDLNRARLEQDAKEHPYARLTGQIAAGSVVPLGNAKRIGDVAKLGAAEGALAGFGAGEGSPVERLPSTIIGTLVGGAGGLVVGSLVERIGIPAYRALRARFPGRSDAELETVLDSIGTGSQSPETVAAMESGIEAPTITARVPDRIDIADIPPPPRGFTIVDEPQLGRVRPTGEHASPEEMAALANTVNPEDVRALPPNMVESLDEFTAATGGVQRQLEAPNPADELAMQTVNGRNTRGPADLVTWIREQPWSLKDDGGDLAHMGIDNKPRVGMDFAGSEGFRGRLIDNDAGRSLDDAAQAAWEAGYFPHHAEPPSIPEFLDVLNQTHRGTNRAFRTEDLEQVGRFGAARADADMIRAAEQEGRPLYEDLGETINLDDLNANAPPAYAYEDSPRLVGKVGNINLAHIESPADVSRLLEHVQSKVGGFDASRRGAITHEETRLLAEDMGMRPEDLLRRRQGQALNAEQLYAMRAIHRKSLDVVERLARNAIGGSDEDLAQFRNAWLRHVAIQDQVAGATAEAGRALSQFRMVARAGDAKASAVSAYLKGGGGREAIEDVASKLVDMMEDPAKASSFMRQAAKAKTWDKINEVWINSLLSGPRTHIVNFLGNALVSAYHLPEQALTAGIGAALRTPGRTTLREVASRAAGMIEGARDGLRLMKHAWKTGEPLDAVSKVEARNYQAIPGRLGTIIRTPTRALTAADEFWKAINRRAATNAMAFRRAYSGAGSAEEKAQRFADLVANPDASLMKYADAQARYYTFQAELGEAGKLAQRLSNVGPMKFIFPFVRTPANIIKFAGERSIFAPLMGEFRAAIRAGGNERNEALARLTMGSGLSAWAVSAAMEGKISGGGPTDPEERASLLNSGWQPYSIRIGDQWVSYQRFEPISLLAGVAADYAEAAESGQATPKELNELGTAIAAATAKNITSKTWLSGLSDFFDMLSDPDRYGRAYWQRLTASMAVPAISAHAAGATDPNLREVQSVLDAIKNRVPGLSHDLQERLNVWGEPIKRGSGAGQGVAGAAYNFVSPVYTSTVSKDPVLREAARLRAPISMPQRSIVVGGQRVKLTPEQFHIYVQLSGRPAKVFLDGYIGSQEWRDMPDSDRREFLKETLSEFRDSARDELKAMYPELGGVLPPAPPAGFVVAK